MKVIQISDLHIGLEGELCYEVDTRKSYLDLINQISILEKDLVIVTGDIAFRTGSEPVYEYFKSGMSKIGCPWMVTAGNHDDKILMKAILRDSFVNSYAKIDAGKNNSLLILDSSEGRTDVETLSALGGTDEQFFVFTHYPPVRCGVPHMDNNYSIRNESEYRRSSFPSVKAFFCGHYHIDRKVTDHEGRPVYICPSGWFQIDAYSQTFKISSRRPGYRIIEFNEQELVTQCEFLQ